MEWMQTLTLVFGSSFLSGINLYLVVAALGLFERFSFIKLPGGLDVLANGWVLLIAVVMLVLEFCADKVFYLDTCWDIVHTFIRVPAAAVLAFTASADLDPATRTMMVLLGGGTAFASHATVSTTRAFANLSPEPFSTLVLSIIEDVLITIGVLIVSFAPIIIAVIAGIFLVLFLITLPLTIYAAVKIFRKMSKFFSKAFSYLSGDSQPVNSYAMR